MSGILQSRDALSARLAELPHLPRKQLVELWVKHVGQPPPKAASTALLLRAVAYALQDQQFDGLKRQELRSLHKAAGSGVVRASGQKGSNKQQALNVSTSGTPSSGGLKAGSRDRDKATPSATRIALRPGTRLVREWQGRSHSVDVRADGLRWNGTVYRSLSAVALAITGARWSGNRFFRL